MLGDEGAHHVTLDSLQSAEGPQSGGNIQDRVGANINN